MTQWIVYKKYFYTPADDIRHCMEFIASVKGKIISEKGLMKSADRVMDQLSTGEFYDFGSLTWPELMDDIRKLMLIEYPRDLKLNLWFDKDETISFWDDGCH